MKRKGSEDTKNVIAGTKTLAEYQVSNTEDKLERNENSMEEGERAGKETMKNHM